MRINVGCGKTPINGWVNYDNSFSLRLSKLPFIAQALYKLRLLSSSQYQFVQFSRASSIFHGDAIKGLPHADDSCDVVYSSHMIEHFDRQEAAIFLKEAFRVLRPGGIIRIVAPNIKHHVEQYLASGDANAFIESTLLCVSRPRSPTQKIKQLFIGSRHHLWMYDGKSLTALLKIHGFEKVEELVAGQTNIYNPQSLDLFERVDESIYVEGVKPTA